MHILEIFLLVHLDFHKLAAMNTVVVCAFIFVIHNLQANIYMVIRRHATLFDSFPNLQKRHQREKEAEAKCKQLAKERAKKAKIKELEAAIKVLKKAGIELPESLDVRNA